MNIDRGRNDTGSTGNYRWAICALLFFCTTINYIDRNSLSVPKTTLERALGWTAIDYGWITTAFTFAYAMFPSLIGFVVDRLGVKRALAAALVLWSLAAAAHGLVATVLGFVIVRFVLGFAEAANFPASIKAVAMWFPQKERALATGLFNAGANVGAIITPLIVPVLTLTCGRRAAFVITGAASLIWLVAWLALYRRPRESKRLSSEELAYIESDPADQPAKVPWVRLLRCKETWAFAVGKFLTDPIWWMFLFWTPDFLVKRHGLDLKTFGPPLVVIYVVSDLGSIFGGWLSSRLIHRGWSINRARKTAMLMCAIAVTPIFFAQYVDNLWGAVAIISLATAAHQAWSANLYTLPSDTFPRKAVGSVIGIGGTAGALGGMIFSLYIGQVLERLGSYTLIFAVAGYVYLIALLIIHLLSPRLDEAKLANA